MRGRPLLAAGDSTARTRVNRSGFSGGCLCCGFPLRGRNRGRSTLHRHHCVRVRPSATDGRRPKCPTLGLPSQVRSKPPVFDVARIRFDDGHVAIRTVWEARTPRCVLSNGVHSPSTVPGNGIWCRSGEVDVRVDAEHGPFGGLRARARSWAHRCRCRSAPCASRSALRRRRVPRSIRRFWCFCAVVEWSFPSRLPSLSPRSSRQLLGPLH